MLGSRRTWRFCGVSQNTEVNSTEAHHEQKLTIAPKDSMREALRTYVRSISY